MFDSASEDEDPVDTGGLLQGITAWHIRRLTDSVMDGGAGYNYEEVGRMTLDQIHHRLCDSDLLKNPIGKRTKEYAGSSAIGAVKPDKDGFVAGRDVDGNPIRLKMGLGKSRASMLREAAEKNREEVAASKGRKAKGRRK